MRKAYTARKRQRQRRYGTAVRTPITETVTETDTDEQKSNAGNQALVIVRVSLLITRAFKCA